MIERDGDLIDRALVQVPPNRADDVVVINFADLHNFFSYNPLDIESAEHSGSRLVNIFKKQPLNP
ncbi:hypothetical protein GOACH_22_00530 [Gordonia aichiensis NBRC 108223]|uniref:Uncharacterized protein n=1 Tax=Gordonia aichiensis NBRC 108223 TaxID=1220583 RepID=L7KN01_9ACTN|nr:hypothetical protein GOACH_22_00530 [Gordonia aichiensis NBRC 108223]